MMRTDVQGGTAQFKRGAPAAVLTEVPDDG